jgi:epoxyqueuosine reductase
MMSNDTQNTATTDIKSCIREKALSLGFDDIGFAAARTEPRDLSALAKFVGSGYHGDMDWLARDDGRRGTPSALMPTVKTIIVLGMNYAPKDDPLAALEHITKGVVSVYATRKDYHDVIKKRLKQLGRWIGETFETDLKVFVDTAPVMEKPLAARAGIGWQGKHTNLVSRRFGSWLFLGEIFIELELPPDAPEMDHCGSCDRCLQVCPTDAFPAPYELDARKCISYLTIEHKDHIDELLMDAMGNHVYGCDDCLSVCPWTKFSQPHIDDKLTPNTELQDKPLAELAALDDAEFREMFRGTPVKRTGRERFVRNVLIAIGNSGDATLRSSAEALLEDPSPLVAAAAMRAVAKLSED